MRQQKAVADGAQPLPPQLCGHCQAEALDVLGCPRAVRCLRELRELLICPRQDGHSLQPAVHPFVKRRIPPV